MAIQCPVGAFPIDDGSACVDATGKVVAGIPSNASAGPGRRTGVIQSQNGHTLLIDLDTGETIQDLGQDPRTGAAAANGGVSRSESSSTNRTIQDPAAIAIDRDRLALDEKKLVAAEAKDKADAANAAALLALQTGNAAEAKRQFDIASAETQRYHTADLEARKEDSRLAQTKFAFDAYTKLQEVAANPRNFLQSFFLQRGQDVPSGVAGGAATNTAGPAFTSFLPSFLSQMGLGSPTGGSSSGVGGGGAAAAALPTPNYSPGVTQQAAANPAGALAEILKNQAAGSKVGMLAKGGIISEPYIAVGLNSGKVITLGEEAPAKPETVVPAGKTLEEVRGKLPADGMYDTGGELGYGVGTQAAAGQNQALMQLLNSLTGTALSKAPTSEGMASTNTGAANPAVPASPYNTFANVQVPPAMPAGSTLPNLAPLYNGTATNTPLQQFQSQGAVPPFLTRLFQQGMGNAAMGTSTPQRFALPKDVPLVSALAYSQMTPSEQQALLSYVSGYGVDPQDYLAQVQNASPTGAPQNPQFAFLGQR